jgi:hypothetical protein
MYQKLLTKADLNRLPSLYSQESVKDPIVYLKLFHPIGSWTLYITEFDPKEKIFFGWNPIDGELGYSSLAEIEAIKVRGLGVERDVHFSPKPLSYIKAGKENAPYTLPRGTTGGIKRRVKSSASRTQSKTILSMGGMR